MSNSEQAKKRMNNLSELLELTKTRYIELGGVLEEGEKESLASQQEDEGCVCMCVCDCLFEFVMVAH